MEDSVGNADIAVLEQQLEDIKLGIERGGAKLSIIFH